MVVGSLPTSTRQFLTMSLVRMVAPGTHKKYGVVQGVWHIRREYQPNCEGMAYHIVIRAVYRNFAMVGEFGVWEKEGAEEALCMRSTPSRGIWGHAPLGKF